MLTMRKAAVGVGVLQARFSRRPRPVIIGWALTNRCNLRCRYCTMPNVDETELPTSKVLSIIDELAECGCRSIAFTGGEPLLRDDLRPILRHCRSRGIYTTITTNGTFVRETRDLSPDVDQINLSFDGPKDLQDTVRGPGAYESVLELLRTLPRGKATLSCVLHKYNVDHVDYVLETAAAFGARAHFQPVSDIHYCGSETAELAASDEDLRRALVTLLDRKRRFPIMNSRAGLEHFLTYRTAPRQRCAAGKASFRITASGQLLACHRQLNASTASLASSPVREAIRCIEEPDCHRCCLANGVELAQCYFLNPQALWDAAASFVRLT